MKAKLIEVKSYSDSWFCIAYPTDDGLRWLMSDMKTFIPNESVLAVHDLPPKKNQNNQDFASRVYRSMEKMGLVE